MLRFIGSRGLILCSFQSARVSLVTDATRRSKLKSEFFNLEVLNEVSGQLKGAACAMMGNQSGASKSSQTPTLKKSSSSSSKQTSIAGFFQKKPTSSQTADAPALPVRSSPRKNSQRSIHGSDQSLTPAPSSDPPEASHVKVNKPILKRTPAKNGLPSPITPADIVAQPSSSQASSGFSSPSRKVSLPSIWSNQS